jgi:transcriptional regulator with XRE-family HTH domain
MADNAALRARMAALGLTQRELAARLNLAIGQLTGREGTISERTIYEMVHGITQWPRACTRKALAEVLGVPCEQLGFRPPRRQTTGEAPVIRREFLAKTAAVSAAPLAGAHRVGASDVERLRTHLDALDHLDQSRGGHAALEAAALAGARAAIEANQRSASERVHRQLLSLAAEFTLAAGYSSVDAMRLDQAEAHLDRAASLAGLSQDPVMQLRVWVIRSMCAHQQYRKGDELAAAQAALATGVCRSDPFFRSMALARVAVSYADGRDRQAALRSIGRAAEALTRADASRPRPGGVSFYCPGEVYALSAITHQFLGEPALSEAAGHRSLSLIPGDYRRNRAMVAARVALAQLDQAEVERAVASAHQVIDLMGADPLPGRLRTLIGDLHRALLSRYRDVSEVEDWIERRREWSRPA